LQVRQRRRHALDRLFERGQRLLQTAGSRLRARESDEQTEAAPVVLLNLRQQPQGRRQPARRDGGRARGGLQRRPLKDRRALLVADAGAALDVMRARRQRARSPRQRRGGTRVSAKPPRLGRRLVDRVADDRMAEAIALRHAGRTQDVAGEQLVECFEGQFAGQIGSDSRDLEVHRIAHDGSAPGKLAGRSRERVDLVRERDAYDGRHTAELGDAGDLARN
jgi:hypothetical protein